MPKIALLSGIGSMWRNSPNNARFFIEDAEQLKKEAQENLAPIGICKVLPQQPKGIGAP
jgi:hypothetical protein